jgi:hypothetical protein
VRLFDVGVFFSSTSNVEEWILSSSWLTFTPFGLAYYWSSSLSWAVYAGNTTARGGEVDIVSIASNAVAVHMELN